MSGCARCSTACPTGSRCPTRERRPPARRSRPACSTASPRQVGAARRRAAHTRAWVCCRCPHSCSASCAHGSCTAERGCQRVRSSLTLLALHLPGAIAQPPSPLPPATSNVFPRCPPPSHTRSRLAPALGAAAAEPRRQGLPGRRGRRAAERRAALPAAVGLVPGAGWGCFKRSACAHTEIALASSSIRVVPPLARLAVAPRCCCMPASRFQAHLLQAHLVPSLLVPCAVQHRALRHAGLLLAGPPCKPALPPVPALLAGPRSAPPPPAARLPHGRRPAEGEAQLEKQWAIQVHSCAAAAGWGKSFGRHTAVAGAGVGAVALPFACRSPPATSPCPCC